MNRKAITTIVLTLILVSIMSMAFVTQVVANSELPFEHDFETDTICTESLEWTTIASGTWHVEQDGTKVYSGEDTSRPHVWARALAGDVLWSDYVIELKMRVGLGGYGYGGFFVRVAEMTDEDFTAPYWPMSAGNNFYRIEASNNKLNLWNIVNGHIHPTHPIPLIDVPWVPGTDWHTYKCVLDGPSIKIFVDGTLYIDVTDTSHSHGSIGLETYGSHAHFDDVVVTTLEAHAIEDISDMVDTFLADGSIDNKGVAKSLHTSLNNVQMMINKGNNIAARNMLNAFINHVEAQASKHITAEAAQTLIDSAQAIIDAL